MGVRTRLVRTPRPSALTILDLAPPFADRVAFVHQNEPTSPPTVEVDVEGSAARGSRGAHRVHVAEPVAAVAFNVTAGDAGDLNGTRSDDGYDVRSRHRRRRTLAATSLVLASNGVCPLASSTRARRVIPVPVEQLVLLPR